MELLIVLIGLMLVATIATKAYRHVGTRPLYAAALLVTLAGAGACNALIPSRLEIERAVTEAEQVGGQFLFDYGPSMIILWLAAAGGCLLALIVYRAPQPIGRGATTRG